MEVYNEKKEEYLKLVERPASKSLVDFIKLVKRNGRVLDLGCGPGMTSARMRESGLRVDPIDASIEMVNLAN
ncbi:MAG: methyltransferase domain-containing protein, partial [Paracoccaceae bacterium]|nr:methyltransferase domain-containing protein [Paracoccaceae bacterium]